MKVVAVPDVDAALRVLDLGVQDSTPTFKVHRTEPGGRRSAWSERSGRFAARRRPASP